MTTQYIVTSDRLNGLARGDILTISDLARLETDMLFLIEAGHLSVHKPTKSAKPIDIDPQE